MLIETYRQKSQSRWNVSCNTKSATKEEREIKFYSSPGHKQAARTYIQLTCGWSKKLQAALLQASQEAGDKLTTAY